MEELVRATGTWYLDQNGSPVKPENPDARRLICVEGEMITPFLANYLGMEVAKSEVKNKVVMPKVK